MSLFLRLLCCLAAGLPLSGYAQSREKVAAQTLQEGKTLYYSERASWVATDIFLASIADRAVLGGYLSYVTGDSVRTLFFTRADSPNAAPQVLGDFTFPQKDIRLETARRSYTRPPTPAEQRLFSLRQKVMAELRTGKVLGEPYRVPAKCNLNMVVLADEQLRAYLIVGPKENQVVPIGGDYLLTFNKKDQLVEAQKLHNSYLPFQVNPKQTNIAGGVHTHLPAHPYITPTDICSLLLYNHLYPMSQHIVLGDKYVSLFSIKSGDLVIMDRKDFERIGNNTKK